MKPSGFGHYTGKNKQFKDSTLGFRINWENNEQIHPQSPVNCKRGSCLWRRFIVYRNLHDNSRFSASGYISSLALKQQLAVIQKETYTCDTEGNSICLTKHPVRCFLIQQCVPEKLFLLMLSTSFSKFVNLHRTLGMHRNEQLPSQDWDRSIYFLLSRAAG